MFKVTSSNYDKWFYYSWTKHHLDRFVAVAADKATTMGHIKRDELAKAEVLIPNEADYKRIRTLLQPIYDLIITNRIENKRLVQKINSLPLIDKYELSEKIRTNKELASFIISVRNLNKKPHIPMDYGNVILSYANNYEEACNMIEYFKKQGYVFINYSKSNYNYSPYAKYEEDFDTHHVIGQEFDNVLMLMDDSFYYDENGVLQGVPHPNPDYLYPNLFYQGITRVREKIALVIVNSPRLFEKISSIFDIEQEA